jgi:hypothetical protein
MNQVLKLMSLGLPRVAHLGTLVPVKWTGSSTGSRSLSLCLSLSLPPPLE